MSTADYVGPASGGAAYTGRDATGAGDTARPSCDPAPSSGTTWVVVAGTAAVGAIAGAGVGYAFKSAGAGALVGALAGALAGGLVIAARTAQAAACSAVQNVGDSVRETREEIEETARTVEENLRPWSPALTFWHAVTS